MVDPLFTRAFKRALSVLEPTFECPEILITRLPSSFTVAMREPIDELSLINFTLGHNKFTNTLNSAIDPGALIFFVLIELFIINKMKLFSALPMWN